MVRTALVAMVASFALQAFAVANPRQNDPGEGRRGARRHEGGPPPSEAEIRHAMERVMITQMRKVLQLTPEQESRILPQVKQLLEERRRFASRRRARLAYLRAAVLDEEAEEAAIEKALADVRNIEAGFRERENELRQGLNAELSPRQQAQLLFFERRFRGKMQQRIREAMRRNRGERPGRVPVGGEDPFSEFEDWEDE